MDLAGFFVRADHETVGSAQVDRIKKAALCCFMLRPSPWMPLGNGRLDYSESVRGCKTKCEKYSIQALLKEIHAFWLGDKSGSRCKLKSILSASSSEIPPDAFASWIRCIHSSHVRSGRCLEGVYPSGTENIKWLSPYRHYTTHNEFVVIVDFKKCGDWLSIPNRQLLRTANSNSHRLLTNHQHNDLPMSSN